MWNEGTGERGFLKKAWQKLYEKEHSEICLSLRSFYEGLLFRLA